MFSCKHLIFISLHRRIVSSVLKKIRQTQGWIDRKKERLRDGEIEEKQETKREPHRHGQTE